MTYTFLSLFSGMGGGSLGFQRAGWEPVGAVDNSPSAAAVYEYITGHKATVGDLMTMSPADLRAACSGRPHAVVSSPPCKGNSGCLPASKAATAKYQSMNTLAFRGIWLCLEAWPKSPPPLILVENVPRITTRSRQWLDQLKQLLNSYGYACKETTHDCGELGGLAQHRRRFLLVARHMKQVPEFLYTPPKRRVRAIGEVLGSLPVPTPTNTEGGEMHGLPKLSPLNWLRLALIPPGKDWRALPDRVALSQRAGRLNGGFGVNDWDGGSHTVLSEGSVANTWASSNDPRLTCTPRPGTMGVVADSDTAGAVIGHARIHNSAVAIADARVPTFRREGGHGVKGWDQASTTVIGHATLHNFPAQVADPRLDASPNRHNGKYGVEDWNGQAHTVIADLRTGKGWAGTVDPRLGKEPHRGTLGVRGWAQPSHTIRATHGPRTAPSAVADPRLAKWLCEGPELDLASRRGVHLVIQAADGTWHRPFTDLELAVLQGFPARHAGGWLNLPCMETAPSKRRAERRQHIGNAIPPLAAEAIAREMATTLDAALGGGLLLGGTPVWVAPELRPW